MQEKLLERQENRVLKELQTTPESGQNLSHEICKETDEQKILDMINKDINKSSVFGIDLEKLITELWNQFETFDGITKLVFVMLITNSLILWCVISIILNKYGDYLMDRFKLEARYPKIAIFIQYRKKLTKYYL
jgi:hypothetical protein